MAISLEDDWVVCSLQSEDLGGFDKYRIPDKQRPMVPKIANFPAENDAVSSSLCYRKFYRNKWNIFHEKSDEYANFLLRK